MIKNEIGGSVKIGRVVFKLYLSRLAGVSDYILHFGASHFT